MAESGRSGLLRRLRSLLPASRRQVDVAHRETMTQLGARLDETNARLNDYQGWIEGALAQTERRVREIQALTARTYEAQERWPERLAAIRAEPSYEEAYTEEEPLVSVRIGTYNQAELLCERALASVRRQTYQRWEAVVVGDACTDDTEERIAAIGDERIRFFNLPYRGPYPNDERALWQVGGIPPFNAAADATKGRWIAPLDHDDEWDDDHIELLLAAAREQHAELAYGRLKVRLVDSDLTAELGTFPPRLGDFAMMGAILHGGLKEFRYDLNSHLAEEPGDWNLTRRLWEAGVRFTYLDRTVGTYFVAPHHPGRSGWEKRAGADPDQAEA
jgi:hypothetical protein